MGRERGDERRCFENARNLLPEANDIDKALYEKAGTLQDSRSLRRPDAKVIDENEGEGHEDVTTVLYRPHD